MLPSVRHWTLGAKLSLTFGLVVAGVAVVVSGSVISHERRALDEELRKRGADVVDNLARLSVELVVQDDLWGLYKVVRDIAGESGHAENVVAYAMVLDSAGLVLAHSDPARHPTGEALEPEPVGRPPGAAAGPTVVSRRMGRETIHDLAAPIVLDNQQLGLARVGITTRYLDVTVARIATEILFMGSLLAALGVALGFLVARRMTRPLSELARAVDRIGPGGLDEPVAVTTVEKDEIGRLADRVNLMTRRLSEGVREIQETSEYLQNLLENANDFIYTLDLDGRLTYVNHLFRELGLCKDALIGRTLDAVMVRHSPSTGAPPTARGQFEVRLTGADGLSRTLVVTESPLLDTDRRVIGRLGIAKDVTERKALESRLIASERLASAGELAGALAHEIRNPLGALLAAAKMLAAESRQAEEYDRPALTRVITEEGRRLNRIVADFLQFARPRPVVRGVQSLNGLVSQVLESLRLDTLAEGKTFRVALDPALPPVPVDADQIKQVVWNVVRNGLEATSAGAELAISTAAAERRVRLEVVDGGPGIPPEQQARLFEPFRTTKPGGSGLGLAIAHRIVAAHGGSIEVASRPGVGTRVSIFLPTGSAAAADGGAGPLAA